jgi:NAD-dependent dihydropyrimidine dehydrogenase PreA subunit
MGELIYLKDVVTLQLAQDRCIGCGMCTVVCPHAVFSLDNGKARIGNRDACMECGACALNCPADAVDVQSGVGCADAVINAALGRKNSACCCIDESDGRDQAGSAGGTSCC